jgi:hypothetical protein
MESSRTGIVSRQLVPCRFEGHWITVWRQSPLNKKYLIGFFELDLKEEDCLFIRRTDLYFSAWIEVDCAEFQQGEHYEVRGYRDRRRGALSEDTAMDEDVEIPAVEVNGTPAQQQITNDEVPFESSPQPAQVPFRNSPLATRDVVDRSKLAWDYEYPDGDISMLIEGVPKSDLLKVNWATFSRTYDHKTKGKETRKFCLGSFDCPDPECSFSVKPISRDKGATVSLPRASDGTCPIHKLELHRVKCSCTLSITDIGDNKCLFEHSGTHRHRKPIEEAARNSRKSGEGQKTSQKINNPQSNQ